MKLDVKRLNRILGNTDEVFRIGGDEFVLVMWQIDFENAKLKFNSILDEFTSSNSESYQLSFSFGVNDRASSDKSAQEMLLEADKLMYINKREKRID